MNRKFICLCSVAALVGNSFATFAQNPVPDKAKTEHRVMVVQSDQGVTTTTVDGGAPHIITAGIPRIPMGGDNVMFAQAGGSTGAMVQMRMENKLVTGKPYSADVVQENTQVLGDGNRIVNRSSAFTARDSQGRMRNEISISFGPLANAMPKAPKMISITDPVAGLNVMLNSDEKVAVKMPSIKINYSTKPDMANGESAKAENFSSRPTTQRVAGGTLQNNVIHKVQATYTPEARAAGAQGTVKVNVTVDEQGSVISAEAVSGHPLLRESAVSAARQWKFQPAELDGKSVKVQGSLLFNFSLTTSGASSKEPTARQITITKSDEASAQSKREGMKEFRIELDGNASNINFEIKKEDLGAQVIEGVQCEGTRSTTTIPAGAVNNEMPINIVSEVWVSKDLEVAVLRKYNDPRFGENVTRLTNINRAEPAKELFEIPADYTIKEEGPIKSFQFVNGEGNTMKFEMRTDQKIITKEQQ